MSALRIIGAIASRIVQPFVLYLVSGSIVFLLFYLFLDLSFVSEGNGPPIQVIEQAFGLDRPLPDRFGRFLGGLFTGDFGNSFRARRPAVDVVRDNLPNSIALFWATVAASAPLGIAIGALSLWLRRRPWSLAARLPVVLIESVPLVIFGLWLIVIFAVDRRVFPPFGFGKPENYVLPVLTLMAVMVPVQIRAVRSAGQAWFATLGESIARRLTTAIASLVGVFAIETALVLSAMVVVENLFSWPGVFRQIVTSIFVRDYPVTVSIAIVAVLFTIAMTALSNVLYGIANPRASQVAVEFAALGPAGEPEEPRSRLWSFVALVLPIVGVLLFIAIAAGASVVTTDPVRVNVPQRLLPPSGQHPLGTDQFGRDVYARVITGARQTVSSVIPAALFAVVVGAIFGGILGTLGRMGFGWIGTPFIWIIQAIRQFPPLIWLLLFVASSGQQTGALTFALGCLFVVPVIALTGQLILRGDTGQAWLDDPSISRLGARALTAAGALCLVVAGGIGTFELLNFIGLGVPLPAPTLGGILSDGRDYIETADWLAYSPGLVLMLALLSVSALGDTLADALAIRRAM